MAVGPKGWQYAKTGRRKRPERDGKRSSPPGKLRLLIAERTEKDIRAMILTWEEPRITWDAVMKAVNAKFGGQWTRQAIAKHPQLQKVFSETKQRLKKEKISSVRKPAADGTVDVLKRQIASLQEENKKLNEKLSKFEEKFVRWKSNAYLNGWSIKKLDEVLQKIDRGQSDKRR